MKGYIMQSNLEFWFFKEFILLIDVMINPWIT